MKRWTSRPKSHLWGIDLVRFAAALLVVVFHLTWQEASTATVAWFGWIGVQIFFVVSGVVIARSANNTTPLKFVESRALRLYPAAWVCAVISVVVANVIHHQQPDLFQRFVASFMLSPVGPFLASAYWTLPVELAFYMLIFLVIWNGAFERLERVAIWLCMASAIYNIAFAAQTAGLFTQPDLDFGYDWKNLTLLRHGVYFGIGILICLWSDRPLSRSGWWAFGFAVVGASLEITCRAYEITMKFPEPVHMALSLIWPWPIAIWLVSLIVIAWSSKLEHRLGSPSQWFLTLARAAGLATYPLYLLHEQFGTAARNVMWKAGLPLLASACVAALASVLLAVLVAQTAEPVLRQVMRRWFEALGTAAGSQPWLGRLFRNGGTL